MFRGEGGFCFRSVVKWDGVKLTLFFILLQEKTCRIKGKVWKYRIWSNPKPHKRTFFVLILKENLW